MVAGPKQDYTKVISGLLHALFYKKVIFHLLIQISCEIVDFIMKIILFFYEKHFCRFLIQPGWFWIVLEVS